MKEIKRHFQRKKYGLPKTLNDEWFAKVVHCSDEKLPPAFDKNGKFIDYQVGNVVPMKELPDGKFAFYIITDYHYKRGDWLYDSDGYNYDLKFHHIGQLNLKISDINKLEKIFTKIILP